MTLTRLTLPTTVRNVVVDGLQVSLGLIDVEQGA